MAAEPVTRAWPYEGEPPTPTCRVLAETHVRSPYVLPLFVTVTDQISVNHVSSTVLATQTHCVPTTILASDGFTTL